MADQFLNRPASEINVLLDKIDSMESYDDTDIRQLISALTERVEELEAKINGD